MSRRDRRVLLLCEAAISALVVGAGVPLGLVAWGALVAMSTLYPPERGPRRVLARAMRPRRRPPHPTEAFVAAAVAAWLSFLIFLIRPPFPWWHAPAAHVAGLVLGTLALAPLVDGAYPLVPRSQWTWVTERWAGPAALIGGAAGAGLGWQLAHLHPVRASIAPGLHHVAIAAAIAAGALTAAAVAGLVLVAIARGGRRLRREPDDAALWRAAWRAARLVDAQGRPPRLLGRSDGALGTTIWRWAVPAGRADHDVRAKLPVLAHALGVGHLALSDDAPPGEWHIVAAVESPLRGSAFPWGQWREQVLERDAQLASSGTLGFVAGVGHTGALVVHDFGNGDAPHLLVAGQSGSGKSIALTCALMQLVQTFSPDDLVLTLLDPKGELRPFINLPHVQAHLSDATPGSPHENALHLLAPLVAEARDRMASFSSLPGNPRNLIEARAAGLHLPWHVVVVEEAADFLGAQVAQPDKAARQELVVAAAELARKARSAGVLLVLVTQYPTKEAIPAEIKQQCSRLALKMRDQTASTVILGHGGAERLAGQGHGILSVGGRDVELRGFSVSTEERDAAIQSAIDRWGPRSAPLVPPAGDNALSDLSERA